VAGGLYHAVLRGNHRQAIVASRYARAKQRTLATTGHLFERRCRARLVDGHRKRAVPPSGAIRPAWMR